MMQSKVVLHIRNPFLLDASTYISTAVMALLGISGLQSLALQITALILCLTFALLYRFLFRTSHYEQNPAVYFGAQAVVLLMLLLLNSSANDSFNFLFYILTVHATVVLTIRMAAMWTAMYFIIASSVVLLDRGTVGLYAVFFYLSTFVVCAILGHTVQQTELTSERNERLLDELKETQQKLQELAVVEERNRLARDLHDSVKQQVFAISMQLSAARTVLSESDKAYQSVVEAERLAQQAGTELTGLIHQLRPPGLESKTLSDVVREYVTEWSRQNNVAASLNVDIDSTLSLNEEQALFRVIQEALSNIARHSHATEAVVELIEVDSEILLCVADNGIGLDRGHLQKGVGLNSMRERLTQIGATFHVQSEKDSGTQITAKLRRS